MKILVQYEAFEFIDDSSFSIKNLYFNDGLSEFKIGEITLIDLDYYAINKIKINSDLKINLFDKIIIKEYSYKEDNIDHFIDHFEISNLNINNASLIYDFLNSLDFLILKIFIIFLILLVLMNLKLMELK